MEAVDTLVVGAGFSGLAYAHFLRRDDCLVLEASSRAGGLVRTVDIDDPLDLRFETGPETISDPSGAARALALELGVEANATPSWASKRFVVRHGRLAEVPTSPPTLLTGPFLSLASRLRLMTEPFRGSRAALDGSVADFVRHRLGRGVLDALVDPMIAGIHAGDPEDLSARACFPSVVEGVERHGSLFRYLQSRRGATAPENLRPWKPSGGMSSLTDALCARLGAQVRREVRVRGISRSEAADGPSAWTVRVDDRGAETELRARQVVLALPLRDATRILLDVAPAAGRRLATASAESLFSVMHAYHADDVEHPLDGFGYLVSHREGLSHLGTLFSSSLDPDCTPDGVVLLRTMLGGARHPEHTTADNDELTGIVDSEVRGLLGITAEPLWSHVVRHENALPRYDLDHLERVAAVTEALPEGMSLLGNHQRGIGLSALLEQAGALAERHRASAPECVA